MPAIENSIWIRADDARVYALARDTETFPQFMPDVQRIRVLSRSTDGRRVLVEWVGALPEFYTTVKWVEEDIWDESARMCTFSMVSGDFRQFNGVWRFMRDGEGTRFCSSVVYEYDIPLIGPLVKGVMVRKMRANVDSLQRAIRERAEGMTTWKQ